MPNIFRPTFEDGKRPEGFRSRRARIGYELGTELIGASLWEVPPGEAAYPYHFHYSDEELVIVLSGRPSLRTPEGIREAINELAEETGVEVSERDLIPFSCLSEAEAHTIHYPNGDVTHCFALLFLTRAWQGDPRPDGEESTEARFFDLGALPEPLHAPTTHALELLAAYLSPGAFQVR